MRLFEELKKRKVFRAAAIYALVAWGILQVVDVVSEPLNLPLWFSTVTIMLLALGFPIALVFSWIFDLGPDGPSRTPAAQEPASSGRGGMEVALLCVLTLGIGWIIFSDISSSESGFSSPQGTPVVILMDTYSPRGVYDEDTARKSGTNADVLSEVLAGLPIITQKEAIGSTWDRESQVLQQHPSLILIHRSAFFHSMNQDLGVGYPKSGEPYSDEFNRLYQIADNKLVAFLGYMASGDRNIRFLVYSRGTGGGWPDPEYRARWVEQAEGRFPELSDRITAVVVPGGTAAGSFRREDAADLVRDYVSTTLELGPPNE